MSKPLELTIYPRRDKVGRLAQPGYVVGKQGIEERHANYLMRTKRLTDTELAAEFWAAENEAKGLIIDGYHPYPARREAEILLQFTIAPHYFEADQ